MALDMQGTQTKPGAVSQQIVVRMQPESQPVLPVVGSTS